MDQTKVKIRGQDGALMEVNLDLSMYSQAQDQGINLSQFLTREYGEKTDETAYGSVLSQVMQTTALACVLQP